MVTADQIKDLIESPWCFKEVSLTSKKNKIISELESQTIKDDFWVDSKVAQQILKKLSLTKNKVTEFKETAELCDELEVLLSFLKIKKLRKMRSTRHLRRLKTV